MVAGAVLPLNLSHFAMGRLAVSGDRYHGPVMCRWPARAFLIGKRTAGGVSSKSARWS